MSRHFAAYFAIVGTLAFAPGGAANAGPFNMPHFNLLRPQPHFNMPRPQPHFNMLRPQSINQVVHNNQKNKASGSPHKETPADQALGGPTGQSVNNKLSIPSLGGAGTQSSSSGNASAMLVSNVSGGTSGGATPSRFRVIEDGGHFAVVERRSDTVIKAGFESSKAAWAWIANHV
jgi:hypothetical protein